MMINKPRKYKYYAGDYVFALVSQHSGEPVPVHIRLRMGIASKFDWATGPTLNLTTGQLGYSHGSIYVSDIVSKLTEVDVVAAKLKGVI